MTNSRSCVLDAFAEVTGISTRYFIGAMGTDGAEAGIPTQRIIDVLLKFGYAVTPIEKSPKQQNPATLEVKPVFDESTEGTRWVEHLAASRGVMYGFVGGSKIPHAVAWNGYTTGLLEPIEDFHPYILWKLTKIA